MFAVKLPNRPAIQFYVNEGKPPTATINEVIWFIADGDELNLLKTQFSNIPITKGNYCHWSGELANFIFHNLVLK